MKLMLSLHLLSSKETKSKREKEAKESLMTIAEGKRG